MMFFCSATQMIQDDAGLHTGDALRGINFKDLCHVLREIEHHGDVAALAGKRSSAAPAEDWCSELTCKCDSGDNVIDVAWENNSDRDLAVIGTVGSVESATAGVKADLSVNFALQGSGKA
jgi:hypothetical protein